MAGTPVTMGATMGMRSYRPLLAGLKPRGLQVRLCHRLLQEFSEPDLLVFVEPCFKAGDGKTRIPDVFVCNSRQIIGVI